MQQSLMALMQTSGGMQEMYFEARGLYDDAERVITEQLEEAPESQMLLKRRVALEKSKGNIAGAIEALRKYVDIFQTDREAWEELGELYLQACITNYSALLLHSNDPYASYCTSNRSLGLMVFYIFCRFRCTHRRPHAMKRCSYRILPA